MSQTDKRRQKRADIPHSYINIDEPNIHRRHDLTGGRPDGPINSVLDMSVTIDVITALGSRLPDLATSRASLCDGYHPTILCDRFTLRIPFHSYESATPRAGLFAFLLLYIRRMDDLSVSLWFRGFCRYQTVVISALYLLATRMAFRVHTYIYYRRE